MQNPLWDLSIYTIRDLLKYINCGPYDYPDLDMDDPDRDTIDKKMNHHTNLKLSYNNYTRTSQRIIDILLKTPPTENVGNEEKYAIMRLLTRRLSNFTRFVSESIEAVKETLPQIAVRQVSGSAVE